MSVTIDHTEAQPLQASHDTDGVLRAPVRQAALLRAAAGRADALETARSHVAAVDNPILTARLTELERSLPAPECPEPRALAPVDTARAPE